jgi:glycosyltransferase involved in cell wall biosynthesis
MTDNPLVSVLMITYNHEKFIAQAIESVLMQHVNFKYEIVIGDDYSTDGTLGILDQYKRTYPDKIHLLLHDHNLGHAGKMNFISTLNACRGQYIAILEGDDYWTAPNKLQKQVDFLDTHPACAACFHNVNVLYEDQKQATHPFHLEPLKDFFSLEDVVLNFFIPTCSTMFRNQLPNPFPEWYYSMPMGDWPLHILNAEHGNYGYLNEILGVYRVHENSMWSSQNPALMYEKTITAAEIINRYLGYKFDEGIKRNISRWHYEIAAILNERGHREDVIHHIRKHIQFAPHLKDMPKREIIKIIFQQFMPNFFLWTRRLYKSVFKSRRR